MKLKLFIISGIIVAGLCSCIYGENFTSNEVKMSKEELQDKIKGGWVGQVIGVTYGGPTEFKYPGYIPDYVPIKWEHNSVIWYYDNEPGIFDDIYMDLTFVDVFEKHGLDAPVEEHAKAFANAGYKLWHANQAARYNILNGIMPPESGHWLNNPHADDIDFQIEADYAGLMSPGMVNTAVHYTDEIGHIMNYGDGWYGGAYVAAMYSLAFISDDVEFVVKEALKVLPKESKYYQCIADVVKWHEIYPDWKDTWFEIERKWGEDIGCPDGVFKPFNIDATSNGAYIVMGLLYGQGDMGNTIDISTRCGKDSDCNPASAAGILGTILGYSNIPDYWMDPVYPVEDRDFAYTTISLNDVYEIGMRQALQVIEKNGGVITDDEVVIKSQEPEEIRLEIAFEGHYPVDKKLINKQLTSPAKVNFNGIGAVCGYHIAGPEDYIAEVEISVDGKVVEITKLPVNFTTRKHDLFWKYQMPKGDHSFSFKWLNPIEEVKLSVKNLLIYSDTPIKHTY